jgi:hypothetical protein
MSRAISRLVSLRDPDADVGVRATPREAGALYLTSSPG